MIGLWAGLAVGFGFLAVAPPTLSWANVLCVLCSAFYTGLFVGEIVKILEKNR